MYPAGRQPGPRCTTAWALMDRQYLKTPFYGSRLAEKGFDLYWAVTYIPMAKGFLYLVAKTLQHHGHQAWRRWRKPWVRDEVEGSRSAGW